MKLPLRVGAGTSRSYVRDAEGTILLAYAAKDVRNVTELVRIANEHGEMKAWFRQMRERLVAPRSVLDAGDHLIELREMTEKWGAPESGTPLAS